MFHPKVNGPEVNSLVIEQFGEGKKAVSGLFPRLSATTLTFGATKLHFAEYSRALDRDHGTFTVPISALKVQCGEEGRLKLECADPSIYQLCKHRWMQQAGGGEGFSWPPTPLQGSQPPSSPSGRRGTPAMHAEYLPASQLCGLLNEHRERKEKPASSLAVPHAQQATFCFLRRDGPGGAE